MKKLLSMTLIALSFNTMAIEFITENQVADKLGAEKVIEVSKYSVETLTRDTKCEQFSSSKSARAYVIKKDKESFLYLTPSGLAGLQECAEL